MPQVPHKKKRQMLTVHFRLFALQFRHKSDNQVNNRQSQVLIGGMWVLY